MVAPPAMLGRRAAKIPPAWTQGPGMGAPRVPAGVILAGRQPTMAGGPPWPADPPYTIYYIVYYIIGYILGPIIGPKKSFRKTLKPKIQIVEIETTYVISTAAFFVYSFFYMFCKSYFFREIIKE